MVSACTEAPLESYEPVVDRFLVDRVQYNRVVYFYCFEPQKKEPISHFNDI